ncbi:MAG TPA: cytochrome c oxidase subunit II [Cyclobacteriaceae bacterium]|jgi:cytochrome c oxidase subunit 2
MKVIVIAGIVLIVVILFLIFRIATLVGILKGGEKRDGQSNQINALLLLIFIIVSGSVLLWYAYTKYDEYTLPVASEHGVITDNLFWVTTLITGFVFIITQALLFYFPFKYQYKEGRKAFFYPDNNMIEMLWTIIPAIALAILIFYGLTVWNDITDEAPQEAERIEILGHQFAWKLRYSGRDNLLGKHDYRLIMAENPVGVDFTDKNAFDDFSAGQMYVPKGRPVELRIRARDVLHSVFAPHFRLKMDAVPGMVTSFWFVPTKTTAEMRVETGNVNFNYEIACTEICGYGHFGMRMIVIVVEPKEFDQWKASQETLIQREPGLLKYVSEDLKELARIKSGLTDIQDKESESVSVAGSNK